MNDSDADNPEVIAKPPLIYLAFILIGLVLGYVGPVGIFPKSAWYATGTALIVFGGVIQTVALRQFKEDVLANVDNLANVDHLPRCSS